MTPNHISGDELSELKRYVLEASRKILVENVDAPRFLPYFRSKFLLDQRECDQIKSCSRQSRYDGAEKLLDVLITKGGTGYDHFCAAIMYDRTQMFLLTTLNKRLEILRDWRKKQVATERHIHQAHEEMMRERAQAHSNRQQQMYNSMYPSGSGRNRTYPLMTATYQGQRHPTQSVPATSRIQVTASNYQSQHHQQNLALPERLPRSPIPMEEPMAPPNTQFLPHPHPNPLVEGPGGNCCYPPFTEPQVAQQHHHQEAHLPHHQQAHSQQIYHHQHHLHRPSVHPSAGQPPSSQQQHGANQMLAGASGYNAAINCPPQAILHGHQYPGYVPPPAPVEPIYPVIMEGGGAYYEQHVPHHNQHYPHHDVLTLNTPTGAMMENLLPGMPPLPTGSASTCSPTAAAPQPMAMPPATTTTDHYMYSQQSEAAGEAEESIHRLPGSSPQYTHSHYGLMLSSPAAPATAADYGNGGTSKDILCGQGGN